MIHSFYFQILFVLFNSIAYSFKISEKETINKIVFILFCIYAFIVLVAYIYVALNKTLCKWYDIVLIISALVSYLYTMILLIRNS